MTEPRKNLVSSSYIDMVLVLLPWIGAEQALAMLLNAGLSKASIERVLTQPGRRRPVRQREALD